MDSIRKGEIDDCFLKKSRSCHLQDTGIYLYNNKCVNLFYSYYETYNKMEEEVNYHLLYKALAKLSPREKTIIQLRFGIRTADGEEKTQKEVADFLGISQSYISRLEKKIIGRLKKDIVRMEGA